MTHERMAALLAEPPRDVTDEDEDLIGSGNAVELLEVWQGLFRGDRLVKAGMLAHHLPSVLPAPHAYILLERHLAKHDDGSALDRAGQGSAM